MVHLVDDWRGTGAGYTPTLPSAWLHREGDVLKAVMVHSGWWDDYNFATVPIAFDILAGGAASKTDDVTCTASISGRS